MKNFIWILLVLTFLDAQGQKWEKICWAGGVVSAMITHENELFIGGNFTDIDGQESIWFGKWDGKSMTYNTEIYGGGGFFAFAEYKGSLYGHGHLNLGVCKWDETRWTSFDQVRQSGRVMYSDGDTLFYGTDFGKLRKYHPDAGIIVLKNPEEEEGIDCIIKYKGELIVAGDFSSFNGIAVHRDGKWQGLGTGLRKGSVHTMVEYKGELYVGGTFGKDENIPGNGLVKWDGTEWSDVNGSVESRTYNGVRDMVVFNDELFVAGAFTEMGGVEAHGLAKWDGSQWTDCGFKDTIGSFPNALAVFGNQIAIGMFDFDTANVYAATFENNIDEAPEVRVSCYPQPANSRLNILVDEETMQGTNVQIRDIKGQLLYNEEYNGQPIDVSAFVSGFYLLTLYSERKGNAVYSRKLSILH